MVSSKARTVEEYLEEIPDGRRETVRRVREVIRENLPEGYEETMNWGMISYEVPLSRFPDTYNGKPLMYMALAAQKHHFAVYSTGVYMDPGGQAWLEKEFQKAGKALDMGKSCIRFKRLEDVPLPVIGEVAARHSVETFLEAYREARSR